MDHKDESLDGADNSAAIVIAALSRLLRIDLARAWSRPPTVATLGVVATTTSIFYCIGGGTVLIVTPLLGQSVDANGFVLLSLIAIVTGAICFFGRSQLPRWFYFLAVLWGTCLITGALFLSHNGIASMALSLLYLFVAVDAAFFFSIRAGLVQYVLMLAAALVAFGHAGIPAGSAILLAICNFSIMGVVMWLARKIDDVEDDSLTGLLNRRGVDRRLEEAIHHATADSAPLYAALIDLDKFKLVNDAQGHLRGDRLLSDCAYAWEKILPSSCHLGRYGGDEFLLVMPDQDLTSAIYLADRLRAATPSGATASIGVAEWTPGESASMLLSRADTALYQAKSSGRNRTATYGDSGHARHDMEVAVANGEFRVVYQPIVHLTTRVVVGYEALLRWEHPRHGLRLPNEFIAQAEHSGAIHLLGYWLAETVINDLSNGFAKLLPININVSAHELRRQDYAEKIITLLNQRGVSSRALVVEVTESALGDEDPQIINALYKLREHGVQVAIDDFGSGYSSLRRIHNLPIDIIKLDGAMVQSMTSHGGKTPILEALVTMGKGLGVRLVAEWVDTEEQAAALRALGYQFGQGFLFGHPTPRKHHEELSAKQKALDLE